MHNTHFSSSLYWVISYACFFIPASQLHSALRTASYALYFQLPRSLLITRQNEFAFLRPPRPRLADCASDRKHSYGIWLSKYVAGCILVAKQQLAGPVRLLCIIYLLYAIQQASEQTQLAHSSQLCNDLNKLSVTNLLSS